MAGFLAEIPFVSGSPLNTAVDVNVEPQEANGSHYEVALTNPGSVPVTVHVKERGEMPDEWPEVTSFSVAKGDEGSVQIGDGDWNVAAARVTVTLDGPLGAGQGFEAELRVRRLDPGLDVDASADTPSPDEDPARD